MRFALTIMVLAESFTAWRDEDSGLAESFTSWRDEDSVLALTAVALVLACGCTCGVYYMIRLYVIRLHMRTVENEVRLLEIA